MAMLQGNIRSALIEGSTSTLVSGLSPDDIDHSSSFFSHTASVEEDEMLDKPVAFEGTSPEFYPPLPQEESFVNASKVCHRIEYQSWNDHSVIYTKDVTKDNNSQKHRVVHDGPIFDIVDVNYTTETKDTRKHEHDAKKGTELSSSDRTPSVQWGGNQYIRIYSRAVVNALQSVVNYYPNQTLAGSPVDIYKPYAILAHHWEPLERFRASFHPDAVGRIADDCEVHDTYEHLGYLLEFMERELRDEINKEHARWEQDIPKASFGMLWLLFPPGTDVYYDEDDNGSQEPYVISQVSFRIINQSWNEYSVDLWNLDGHEHEIRPHRDKYFLTRFHGEKPITELSIFPCKYHPDHKNRYTELVKRGTAYYRLRQKRCMYYDGEGDSWPRLPYKGYVMVDPGKEQEDLELAYEETDETVDQKPSALPLCNCDRCCAMETERTRPAKFEAYKKIELKKTTGLTHHQYFICNRSTWAFILGIREWKLLFIDGFSEPKWDLGLIDGLVLKSHYKDMLKDLSRMFVEQQLSKKSEGKPKEGGSAARPTPWTADYIENKGKGLVFLLHGKPGVGKTYTAECIAHQVKRPLLSVTCADIGVEPREVENNLRRWFKTARRWDAIMLLDEADIYMEYRQIHDLTRNNLVAGFLRAIEYYDGVLFLTTNRIGTFDEAFLSRITAIYYDNFSDDDRKQIWGNYFEKLEMERGADIYVPMSTKEYATDSKDVRELLWNGREIRNAFQIAVNLAQAEGNKNSDGKVTVKEKHIKVTVELSRDFKRYMVSLHHKTESERARVAGTRYDDFGAPKGLGANMT
ncbi:hypothetical protein HBH56_145150 [Parastagonospora nodorum]|uniref:AAA+ ATPase domain-containing protein n=1 Tax=Phaeosphaeria nodorum (strain SN15 / ATCC MYA-4574 / FGSC 10173) TaxID=321614 RepID=A0A7U2F9T3_PHANO|nr:hypothetical protein HBH56_145150 [Parastagonospora nodorum]QRD01350.1 hypothetical protein JI435_120310 [Parastagonospora nodorum SN15]KAH3927644.1 hypothetical protein HBH54_150340 [Parastagonospora nodorum]KAH3960213.1 hypothetical protein HBH51_194200 [Parastagonospora nodorum]KAH3971127.1 hypothetical protein HBH52_161140 [Parastagonospora nodorum]